MPFCSKVKNPCKICFQNVKHKNGVQCQGACQTWIHFKCLKYSPEKVKNIKAGILNIICPCPDCKTDERKEIDSKNHCCTNSPESNQDLRSILKKQVPQQYENDFVRTESENYIENRIRKRIEGISSAESTKFEKTAPIPVNIIGNMIDSNGDIFEIYENIEQDQNDEDSKICNDHELYHDSNDNMSLNVDQNEMNPVIYTDQAVYATMSRNFNNTQTQVVGPSEFDGHDQLIGTITKLTGEVNTLVRALKRKTKARDKYKKEVTCKNTMCDKPCHCPQKECCTQVTSVSGIQDDNKLSSVHEYKYAARNLDEKRKAASFTIIKKNVVPLLTHTHSV